MTEHNSPKNEYDEDAREEKINALLYGELDQDESESLKEAATSDQELASAIVGAYQLQRAMEHVQVEKAPASLRRRLKQIPRQNRPALLQPRWVTAFAVVPLLLLGVVLLRSQVETGRPAPELSNPQAGTEQAVPEHSAEEQARIDQARQDLAVAFAYIGQVSDRTSNRIETELGDGMSQAVAGSIFKTIQHQKIL